MKWPALGWRGCERQVWAAGGHRRRRATALFAARLLECVETNPSIHPLPSTHCQSSHSTQAKSSLVQSGPALLACELELLLFPHPKDLSSCPPLDHQTTSTSPGKALQTHSSPIGAISCSLAALPLPFLPIPSPANLGPPTAGGSSQKAARSARERAPQLCQFQGASTPNHHHLFHP